MAKKAKGKTKTSNAPAKAGKDEGALRTKKKPASKSKPASGARSTRAQSEDVPVPRADEDMPGDEDSDDDLPDVSHTFISKSGNKTSKRAEGEDEDMVEEDGPVEDNERGPRSRVGGQSQSNRSTQKAAQDAGEEEEGEDGTPGLQPPRDAARGRTSAPQAEGSKAGSKKGKAPASGEEDETDREEEEEDGEGGAEEEEGEEQVSPSRSIKKPKAATGDLARLDGDEGVAEEEEEEDNAEPAEAQARRQSRAPPRSSSLLRADEFDEPVPVQSAKAKPASKRTTDRVSVEVTVGGSRSRRNPKAGTSQARKDGDDGKDDEDEEGANNSDEQEEEEDIGAETSKAPVSPKRAASGNKDSNTNTNKMAKVPEVDPAVEDQPPKKKRGRPPKKKPAQAETGEHAEEGQDHEGGVQEDRGREEGDKEDDAVKDEPPKRKRGRPPKQKPSQFQTRKEIDEGQTSEGEGEEDGNEVGDGTVTAERPASKSSALKNKDSNAGKKAKVPETEPIEEGAPPKKKRGRPRKDKGEAAGEVKAKDGSTKESQKKKRKVVDPDASYGSNSSSSSTKRRKSGNGWSQIGKKKLEGVTFYRYVLDEETGKTEHVPEKEAVKIDEKNRRYREKGGKRSGLRA